MKAKYISRRQRASAAAARWKQRYCPDGVRWPTETLAFNYARGTWEAVRDKSQVYLELVELGENPEPEAVNDVIGNGSWVDIRCSGCGRNRQEAVMVGEEPDHESSTAVLCAACVGETLAVFLEGDAQDPNY